MYGVFNVKITRHKAKKERKQQQQTFILASFKRF